jgi:hypothetical protein
LIEVLLALSAGLARRKARQEIINYYPLTWKLSCIRRRLQAHALQCPAQLKVFGFHDLQSRLSEVRPHETILVTANLGEPPAFAATCARGGLRLAVAYHTIDESRQAMLRKSGVELIYVQPAYSVLELFQRFDAIRRTGYFLCFVVDVPFETSKKMKFLGYEIPISRLASAYAKKAHCAVHSLISKIDTPWRMSFELSAIADHRLESIIGLIEQTVLRQPFQYQWSPSAVIFADQRARHEAMSFVVDVLQFRDQIGSRDFVKPLER